MSLNKILTNIIILEIIFILISTGCSPKVNNNIIEEHITDKPHPLVLCSEKVNELIPKNFTMTEFEPTQWYLKLNGFKWNDGTLITNGNIWNEYNGTDTFNNYHIKFRKGTKKGENLNYLYTDSFLVYISENEIDHEGNILGRDYLKIRPILQIFQISENEPHIGKFKVMDIDIIQCSLTEI